MKKPIAFSITALMNNYAGRYLPHNVYSIGLIFQGPESLNFYLSI
jgi:hypothetical protein